MNVEIKLLKREGTYEKDGKEKQFTNFYLQVNGELIPIEVKYFPKAEFGNRDPGYQGRVLLLSTLAELLPNQEKTKAVTVNVATGEVVSEETEA